MASILTQAILMLQWVIDLMNSMGYIAIVLLMFLENVFPPIPSELIMPLAGYTVTKGKLTFIGAVLAGTTGSVLGALPLYYLGKAVGQDRLKEWADKHGKWLTVSRKDIEKSKSWFIKHGALAVFFCRLVPGIRSLISIPAGVDKMPLPQFLFYTALGAALWSTLLVGAGYILGANFSQVDKVLGPASYIVLGGLVALYIYRVVKQHKTQTAT